MEDLGLNRDNRKMVGIPIDEWEKTLRGAITLRDFFAGLAMQKHMDDDGGAPTTSVAKWAYEQADAMMKARQTDDRTSDRGE
jgi:hypothetical protein